MNMETARARLIAEMMESNPRFNPRRGINIAEALGEMALSALEQAYAVGNLEIGRIVDDYWWNVASDYLDKHPSDLADFVKEHRDDRLDEIAMERVAA
ncbi:hypothetical protein [Chitiniphilus eburneus]|uniref:Uncharacterized protein n=1 Tax=Chitiniphilus eburneus TaxID=2571148 RepID=A0A4V5MS12_9NEIS|nr:hypothetical protein [Chitiniphilus eburneus]TJZ75608.1 hypothetical protein FAZ21_06755 [Chitiniphilus eburneus]